jgi:hypothetical protein
VTTANDTFFCFGMDLIQPETVVVVFVFNGALVDERS